MFIWRFWKTAFTGASTSRATVGFGAMAHIPIGKEIYQYCSVISLKISIFNRQLLSQDNLSIFRRSGKLAFTKHNLAVLYCDWLNVWKTRVRKNLTFAGFNFIVLDLPSLNQYG